MDQAAVTLVCRVRPEALDGLGALLARMGQDPAENDVIPFARLTGVHFARLVLLEPARDLQGRPLAPTLVTLLDVDGPADRSLVELVDVAAGGLDRVFEHCEEYPFGVGRTPDARLAYLRRHQTKASAFYVNTRGRSVAQIHQEAGLRDALQGYLDGTRAIWEGAHAQVLRGAVRDFVRRDGGLGWALRRARRSPMDRARDGLDLAASAAVLLLVAPFALVALPVLAALLRMHELTDVPERARPSDEHVQRLAAQEDHAVQNQFSVVGLVKPGPFRQLTARAVLWLANVMVRHHFNRANLSGVKTIHFARWVFLDGGRRLIFASNYDGTLENYMDDFIDKVGWGLNAVFSNGVGYPRTTWLVKDGAADEQAFKALLRSRQFPTQVWFAAYQHLTAMNIENNARIREGLSGRMRAVEAEEWLRRL